MNVTDFKNFVTESFPNLNHAEHTRLKNLTARGFKYASSKLPEAVTLDNIRKSWQIINMQLAKEDKFHRIQTHSMRNYRGCEDYSNQAYNGSSDDL